MIKKAKAGKLVLRIIEEEKMDCVICGEYFAESTMTEIKGDQRCCVTTAWHTGCYEEHGTECWKCDEKIIPDIEEEEASSDILEYYYENCDDGDCCATCMLEIVKEHQEEQEEDESDQPLHDRIATVFGVSVECVHYLYRCNKCDFMTINDDIDCSNCGAKYCMMAKCTK